jgi:hypothetical protein
MFLFFKGAILTLIRRVIVKPGYALKKLFQLETTELFNVLKWWWCYAKTYKTSVFIVFSTFITPF